MSEKYTTSGASLEALGRLLAECNSPDCRDEDATPPDEAKLLLEQLARPWPPHQHGSDAATVADAILASATTVIDLNALKKHGKRFAAQGERPEHHAVGVAICFAAIDAAIVHCGEKLSTYSASSLARSFRMLMEKDWITPDLFALLAEATRICQDTKE
jgi:hypothetical protein